MKMNEALKKAFLDLEKIPGVSVRDTYYDNSIKSWVIYFSIELNTPDLIRKNPTYWYCFVGEHYPFCQVAIYPCNKNGIEDTFFHQDRNLTINKKWKSGKLCLNYSFDKSGKRIKKIENFSDPHKLLNHIQRAVEWVNDANEGLLVRKGDPFELPDFSTGLEETVGFVSTPEDIQLFNENPQKIGTFETIALSHGFSIVTSFLDTHSSVLIDFRPEDFQTKNSQLGVWVYIESPPVLNKWQTPSNFRELNKVLESNQINIDNLIKITVEKNKSNKTIHYWALGFPIEELIGQGAKAIHWQFLKVPKTNLNPPGFRNATKSLTLYNKSKWLNDNLATKWIRSKNTHPEYIFSRIPKADLIRKYDFIILGTGSLGSIITESLARSGAMKFKLYDIDVFTEGNLCRHTLKISDLGKKKAQAVAESIKQINPFIEVTHYDEFSSKTNLRINENTIIIDTTSEDLTLRLLEEKLKVDDNPSIPLFSFSFGLEGSPVYCYLEQSKNFSLDKFSKSITPFLEDRELPTGANEGIGCWSPIFPCSVFSIQSAANICFEFLKHKMLQSKLNSFAVYKNSFNEEGEFVGITKQN